MGSTTPAGGGGLGDLLGGETARLFSAIQERVEKLKHAEAMLSQQRAAWERQRASEVLEQEQREAQVREAVARVTEERQRVEAAAAANASQVAAAQAEARQRSEQAAAVLAEVDRRSRELEALAEAIAAREASLSEAGQRLIERQRMLEQQDAETTRMTEEIRTRAATMVQIQREIEARQAEAQARWAEVDTRLAQLARFKQDLDGREASLLSREAESTRVSEEARRLATVTAEAEQRLAATEAATRTMREQAEALRVAGDATLRKAKLELGEAIARAEAAAKRAEDAEEQRQLLELSQAEASERAARLEVLVTQLQAELEAERGRERGIDPAIHAKWQAAAQESANQLRHAQEAAETREGTLRAALDDALGKVREAGSRAERLEMALREAMGRAEEATNDAARATEAAQGANGRIAELERRLGDVTEESNRASAQLQAQMQAQVRELTAERDSARREAGEWQARLEQMTAAHMAEVSSLRRAVDDAAGAQSRAVEEARAAARAEGQFALEAAQAEWDMKLAAAQGAVKADPAQDAKIAELESKLARAWDDAAVARVELERVRAVSEKLGLEAKRVFGERATLEQELAQWRARAGEMEAAHAAQVQALTAAARSGGEGLAEASARHEAQLREITAMYEARIAEAQGATEQALAQGRAATERAEALAAELDFAKVTLATPQAIPAPVVVKDEALEAEASALRAETSRLRERLEAREAEIELVKASLTSTRDDLAMQTRSGVDGVAAAKREIEALSAQVQALTARAEEAERTAEAARAQAAEASAQAQQAALVPPPLPVVASEPDAETLDVLARLRDTVAQRESSIRNLGERLERAEREAAELKAAAAQWQQQAEAAATVSAVASPAAAVLPADSELRRERLSKLRAAIRQRDEKLDTAFAALKHKEAMLDRMVEQRVQSAMAAAALAPKPMAEPQQIKIADPTIEPTTARNGEAPRPTRNAGLVLAASLLVGATLTPLVYWITPALLGYQYSARMTVKADTGGLNPIPSEMKFWTRRTEDLITDTAVFGATASKLSQQNRRHLGTTDQAREFIMRNLSTQKDVEGQITLELRASSSRDAEAILRTHVEALVTMANDTRALRNIAYETKVFDAPVVSDAPVNASATLTKLMAAGIGLLGALTVATLGFMGMSVMPAKAKMPSGWPSSGGGGGGGGGGEFRPATQPPSGDGDSPNRSAGGDSAGTDGKGAGGFGAWGKPALAGAIGKLSGLIRKKAA
jgi:chromosome segregation ATPase